MSKKQDQIFFRNFSLVVAGLGAMMVAFFVVAQVAGGGHQADAEHQAQMLAEMTAPVGRVAVAGEVSEPEPAAMQLAAADAVDGEKIYNGLCVACHGISGIGAPVVGDKAAWAPRIAQGMELLYDNAINGVVGAGGALMPARGGGSFSDEEVKAAVDYMVDNSQ